MRFQSCTLGREPQLGQGHMRPARMPLDASGAQEHGAGPGWPLCINLPWPGGRAAVAVGSRSPAAGGAALQASPGGCGTRDSACSCLHTCLPTCQLLEEKSPGRGPVSCPPATPAFGFPAVERRPGRAVLFPQVADFPDSSDYVLQVLPDTCVPSLTSQVFLQ